MIEHKQRSSNLDVIRIFAFLCVVSVHFFRKTEFYDNGIYGIVVIIPITIRNCAMVCVPLFMMLSGYLLKNRTPTKKYYFKLFQTVGIYVLASLACGAYSYISNPGEFSLGEALWGILSFETAPYSWYVEMYIGLFMLIPFLNKMYNSGSEKWKKGLLLTFLILTLLPSILNIWRFAELSWWKRPSSSQDYMPLIPDQWEVLYPFTYYFIGAYLRDYPLKLKPLPTLGLLLGVIVVGNAFAFYRDFGQPLSSGRWINYQSVMITSQSVLVFHFLQNLNLSRLGNGSRKVLAKLSSWVLGAYLCSSIFDEYLYPILCAWEPSYVRRLIYFPLIVLAVAVLSMALSAILNGVYNLCEKLVVKCCSRKSPETQQNP